MESVALVVGEALVDVVVTGADGERELPGGSAANVAVALSRLGREVRFATSYADDPRGAILRDHLAGNRVPLAGDPHVLERTSSAIATIGSDGAASYVFDIDWRLAPVVLREAAVPLVVHTSSLAAVLPPGCEDVYAVCNAQRSLATVSYDVNARPMVTGTGAEIVARIERLAAITDVLKASDEDLEALYPALSVEGAARRLLGLGPAVVAVTMGARGALWLSASGDGGEVAPRPVEVADTIGAGDTFGAGLIHALWERDLLGAARREALYAADAALWSEALGFAVRAAAVTVSRPGADPPTLAELAPA